MSITISAIITAYNSDSRLGDAIQSALSQTYPVHEVIVIDDGSTDPETISLLDSYRNRVTLIRQDNFGVATARNNASQRASGAWLAFLDHDDRWLPDKLEKQVAEISKDPTVALCYGSMIWSDINGNHQVRRTKEPHALWPAIRLANQFPPSVTMIRKDVFLSLGGFKTELRTSCEDWELFVRIAHTHKVCCVIDPVAVYNESWASGSLKPEVMLPAMLSIVDSLLVGISSPLGRWLWRRRIIAAIWHKTALGLRECGKSAIRPLLRSLWYNPTPNVRYCTLALELVNLFNRA